MSLLPGADLTMPSCGLLLAACLPLLVCVPGCRTVGRGAAGQPRPDKHVFAHYMVCCPAAGGGATVEDYQQDILAAQAAGIDGFALNCGGWSLREPHYRQRSLLIYQAAEELQTGFKLFISADYCCGLTTEETLDMVETFRDHPNQFRWQGQPVLSTFGGWTHITEFVDQEFTGDREICYVPFYYPKPAKENPGRDELEDIARQNPTLDGYFSFGAAGTPEAIAASSRAAAEVWHGQGKLYMHPVTPFYRGLGGNYRVFESSGFQGMAKQWESAIESGAEWVEIVTWNDWGEASYVGPFGGPADTDLWGGHWGAMLAHAGFLAASRYYIDWFKAGQPPPIRQDSICYFYRLSPKAVEGQVKPGAPKGRPRGADGLEDRIFVTAFLKRPALLTVSCGEVQEPFELGAGVQHVSLPMAAGTPRFVLERRGRVLIDRSGEQAISATENLGNFNYFSGEAMAEEKR